MAEALLNHIAGNDYIAESAGLEPGTINPLAIGAMKDMDIDISDKKTQSVFDLFKNGKLYHYVITVCDESNSERCPIFPGVTERIHWSFKDPSAFEGSQEEKLGKTIKVRDQIKEQIEKWIKSNG
jgi:arsenate reductase